MKIPCPACDQPTPDGLLCQSCTRRLRRDLADLPGLMDELRVTFTRQSQAGTGNGGRGADAALPYDSNAAHVREDVGNTLTTWVRELDMGDLWIEVRGCWCQPYRACSGSRRIPLPNTTRALCSWLEARVPRIRGHAAVDQLVDEITYQVADVRRAIDNPAAVVFCGVCLACGHDMYAPATAEQAACRYCAYAGIDSVLPVQPARKAMWSAAESELLPRRLILDAFPVYGLDVNPATFRTWIHRGRLQARGYRNGAPLYRLGEALDLARALEPEEKSA